MKIEYYRNLPHIQPIGACFFLTFNLRGAMPTDVLERLKEERQQAIRQSQACSGQSEAVHKEQKRYFAKVDRMLDLGLNGNDWLKRPEIAQIVQNSIHEQDQQGYELIAYCIMPNHVHLVVDTALQLDKLANHESVTPVSYKPLSHTLRLLKGRSARIANLLLQRRGAFWQPESYDHYVRSSAELQRIIDYVLQNPVKAGLVDGWKDWPFTYLSERYM
jgi:REP element-mobilizing transposase RayT